MAGAINPKPYSLVLECSIVVSWIARGPFLETTRSKDLQVLGEKQKSEGCRV